MLPRGFPTVRRTVSGMSSGVLGDKVNAHALGTASTAPPARSFPRERRCVMNSRCASSKKKTSFGFSTSPLRAAVQKARPTSTTGRWSRAGIVIRLSAASTLITPASFAVGRHQIGDIQHRSPKKCRALLLEREKPALNRATDAAKCSRIRVNFLDYLPQTESLPAGPSNQAAKARCRRRFEDQRQYAGLGFIEIQEPRQ